MLYYYDILMIYIIVIHRQGVRNLLHSFVDKKKLWNWLHNGYLYKRLALRRQS